MASNRFFKTAALSTVGAAALLTCSPAFAQSDAAASRGPAAGDGDIIIVTALKGAEGANVQDVPESIRAFGSKEIEAAGITAIKDVVELTPNIVLQPSYRLGVVNLSARGHSTPQQGDSPIVINFDGVQAPSQDFINQDLFDIERIEVLKGPQGALYGAGAIAGAINIITKQPTNDSEGFAKLTVGNQDAIRAVAGFSGPLVTDKLFYRVSGVYQSRDGYIKNRLTGNPVDYLDEYAIRGALSADLDTVRIDLKASYTHTDAGASYYESFPLLPDPVPAIDSLFGGPLGRFGSDISNGQFVNTSGVQTEESREVLSLSGKLEADIAGGVLTSVTGYNKSKQKDFGDLDFQPANILLQDVRYDVDVYNQELRYASDPGASVRYVVGGFFQHRKIYNQVIVLLGDFTTGHMSVADARNNPLNSVLTDGRDKVSSNAWGAFVNLDYDLTPELTFNAAIRYDKVDIKTRYVGEAPAFLALPGQNAEATFDQWQPKLSVSYKPTDDVMLYANYARGFRSGVPNPTAAFAGGLPRFIKPETSDAFEVGIKTSFFDNSVDLNVALFHEDINNRHHYFYGASLQSMTTYRRANVDGAEIELNARLAPGLTFQASGGLMSTKIASDEITEYRDFTTQAVALTVNNRGNILPDTPQRTFNAALRYETDISEALKLSGRIAYRYSSKIYFDTENLIADTGAKNFVDLRLGIANEGAGWGLGLFADNVTNERTYSNYAYSGGAGNYLPNQPRTYGVELNYKF
jgi:iron complex outermembrane receptor protein